MIKGDNMKFFENLFDIKDDDYYGVSGLNSELSAIYIYDTFCKYNKGMIVVTNSLYEANRMYLKLSNYTDSVLFFPMDDFITSEAIAISPEFKSERINTINKLVKDEKYIVVTNLMGILRYLPSKDMWKKSIITLKKGMSIGREYLQNMLYNIGYERETIVTETGKLGVRGYLLDVFPIGEENPVRIEFWGDEIDSIKYFDVESQLSKEVIDSIDIYPYSEFLLPEYNDSIDRKQKYLKHYAKEVCSISDYISSYMCFYYDYNQIEEGYRLLRESIFNYDKDNISDSGIKTDYMFDLYDIKFNKSVFLMNFDNILSNVKLNFEDKYNSNNIDNYQGKVDIIKKDLTKYNLAHKTVILSVDNENSMNRILQYLDDIPIIKTIDDNIVEGEINIIVKPIDTGFIFNNYVVISSNDLFKSSESKKKYHNKFKLGTKIGNLNNISRGDYIVHEAHGIGIYDELCTIVKNGYKKDFIKLIYAGGDVLYIPVEKIDRISKFSGKEGVSVRLDSLGSDKWQKKKAKVRGRLEEIAKNLLKVSAEREAMKGFAFSVDDENQVLFESEFPYEETSDQIKASDAIKLEMEKSKPMDMLLCGDVGYGKTEVAIRAAFKAVMDGKQVAFLVPTTILADQHYNNFLKRFSGFPIKVDMVSRFRSRKQQTETIKALKEGNVDILIGTHRLVSKDIEFKDLGLLIVDEEQRFGVAQKEKIKSVKKNVDVLTLSATPIPRTLHMSLTGVRDISVIETPPEDRYPIQTYVVEQNDQLIRDAILREIGRGGQVYFVYNRVESIQSMASYIQNLVPEGKVTIIHGQMTERQLEKEMIDFMNKEFNILVCTSIIETGIDIPNVNTMVVYDADKMGLSQLYQLRGRVGRSNRVAYTYFTYQKDKILTEVAEKRLKALKDFTELGSGFKIAMRDLEIRGAGNMMSSAQHGQMAAVGYDLYCRMLEDTIKLIKGDIDQEPVETTVDIKVDAFIPSTYIEDEIQKIEIYKKIASIQSMDDYVYVEEELGDRFSTIPKEIYNLMDIAYIKSKGKILNIEEIKEINNEVVFKFESRERTDKQLFIRLLEKNKENILFRFGDKPAFVYKYKDMKKESVLEKFKEILDDLVSYKNK